MLIALISIFTIYSFAQTKIKICGTELKKSDAEKFLCGDTTPVYIEAAAQSEYKMQVGIDSSSQKILIIGDSMLEHLRWRLRDYCKENGHQMESIIWYSSQSEWFGISDTLSYYIKLTKPTYIILVLGANEMFVGDIIKQRTPYVKHIMDQIDTIPYVWVGPPNWRKDTGINDMILRNVGSKRYFPSKNLTYKRFADGAHPRPESAYMWMDSIASFIMHKSRNPILLNPPTRKYSGTPNTTILQPWKR